MSIDTSPALPIELDEAVTGETADERLVEESGFVAEELLVEEISIDGMCGVY